MAGGRAEHDVETFDAFYERTRDRLALQVAALTGDLSEAHDHVQEAFVRAWGRWPRVGALDDPEGWVAATSFRSSVMLSSSSREQRRGAAEQGGITFSSANSLWQQSGFPVRSQFLQTLAAYYRTGVWQTDFAGQNAQALAALNRWTSEHTDGKITKLFDSLDPSTVLVLANALYFYAKWATPFDHRQTEPMRFITGSGQHVTTKFMTGGAGLQTADTADYDAVELPYQGGRYAAVAIMPKGRSLSAFIAGLTAQSMNAIIASVRSQGAQVRLPRFTLISTNHLKSTLMSLGMRAAFTDGADFSVLTPEAVSVAQVVQRVYLSVGEKGTTAAAVTGIAMEGLAGRVATRQVVLDHPFLFLVRDTGTGAISFAAEIQDPTGS